MIAQRLRARDQAFIFFSHRDRPGHEDNPDLACPGGHHAEDTPFFLYGGGAFDPEMLNLMPKEGLEGTAVFTNVAHQEERGPGSAVEAAHELAVDDVDPAFAYGHVYLLKEALERTGSTDRNKIADALHTMKLESGQVVAALNGTVQFDAKGMRVNPPAVLLQWQNGVPVVVYPADVAVAQPLKATQ